MLVVIIISIAAVLQQSVADTQNPPVTPCPGTSNSVVEIQDITVYGAKLGETMSIDGKILVKEVVGQHPVLHMVFARPDGEMLPCDPRLLNCELNLCDGTTVQEMVLSKDWNNTCPVQPGTYTTHLVIPLPEGQEVKNYFGDGNFIVTFNIVDGSDVLGCASVPVVIDVE